MSTRAEQRQMAARRLAANQFAIDAAERREALQALLMSPLLPATGSTAESFRLVRRHVQWLSDWLRRWPGWTLIVHSDLARLRKTPSGRCDATRGVCEPRRSEQQTQFSRHRYAVLCLVLAVLDSEQRQTTLQQIAQRTELSVRSDPELKALDFSFDLKILNHRRDLVAAMRLLENWNVLIRADGDDAQFVNADGDCLYRIDRPALAAVLGSVRGASTIQATTFEDRLTALNETEIPESIDAQNRSLQHSLVRRLLDDPVMYFDELTTREYDYWNSQSERLLKELRETTGLEIERRAEGVALLDPEGGWSDLGLPEAGTRGHATLLLAEWLAGRLRRRTAPDVIVTYEEVGKFIAMLASDHVAHWRKNTDTSNGVQQLTDQVINVLHALGLLDTLATGIRPRPAIGRFRVEEPGEHE